MKSIIHWHENFYPIIGGGPAHIENLIYKLNPNYRHTILTNHIKNCSSIARFSKNSIIYRIPDILSLHDTKCSKLRIVSYPFRFINDTHCLYLKYKFLKKSQFNILHVHGVVFYKAILRLNRVIGRDVYQRIVDFSFVNKPKLLTLHNFFPGCTNSKITTDAYNHYINQFDNIICVDKHISDYCVEYSKERKITKRITYIPNSVDTSRFNYSSPQKKGKLKIGFVGRLSRTTDLDMLNKLISNLPRNMEIFMAVVGNVDVLGIPSSNDERVTILQNIPQSNMPNFYSHIDVLFNPFLYKGITRVTLEAMSCGRPVIMYNIGERYPLVHNLSGYIVEPDFHLIMNTLQHIHEHFTDVKYFGLCARNIIEKEFSNDIVMPKVEEIYKDLIHEK